MFDMHGCVPAGDTGYCPVFPVRPHASSSLGHALRARDMLGLCAIHASSIAIVTNYYQTQRCHLYHRAIRNVDRTARSLMPRHGRSVQAAHPSPATKPILDPNHDCNLTVALDTHSPERVLPCCGAGDWAAAGPLRPGGHPHRRLRAALVHGPAAHRPRASRAYPPGAALRTVCYLCPPGTRHPATSGLPCSSLYGRL